MKTFRFFAILFLLVAIAFYWGVNEFPYWWARAFSGSDLWSSDYWAEGIYSIFLMAPEYLMAAAEFVIFWFLLIFTLFKSKIIILNYARIQDLKDHKITKMSLDVFKAIWPSPWGSVLITFFGLIFVSLAVVHMDSYGEKKNREFQLVEDIFPKPPEDEDKVSEPILNNEIKSLVYLDFDRLESLAIRKKIIAKDDLKKLLTLNGISLGGFSFAASDRDANKRNKIEDLLKKVLSEIDSVRNLSVLTTPKVNKKDLDLAVGEIKSIEKKLGINCSVPALSLLEKKTFDNKINYMSQIEVYDDQLIFFNGPVLKNKEGELVYQLLRSDNSIALQVKLTSNEKDIKLREVLDGKTSELKVLAVPLSKRSNNKKESELLVTPIAMWL